MRLESKSALLGQRAARNILNATLIKLLKAWFPASVGSGPAWRERPWARYGIAVALVLAALLLRLTLTALVGDDLPTYITFYPAVVVAALLGGFRPGMLATVLTVAVVDYWIVAPGAVFLRGTAAEAVGVVLFWFMGFFLSLLTERYRRAREQAAAYEKELALRQTREELRRHQERFHVILSSITEAVVSTDTGGRITFLNPTAEKLTGWTEKEALGQPVQSVFKTVERTTRQPAEDLVTRVLREQQDASRNHPVVLVARDGHTVPIEESAAPLQANGGGLSGVVVVFRDVTEALQTAQSIREKAEQYRLALEAGGLGAWDYNFRTGEVFWDERCRNLFGVGAGDHIDYQKAIGIIHEADRGVVDRAVQATLAPGSAGTYACEYRVVWPDGSLHWVAGSGHVYFEGEGVQRKPQRFIGTVRDITGSRLAQEAVRASEAQFRAIFEVASVGIVQVDPGTGLVLRCNDKYSQITGYPPGELRGLTFRDLTHPGDRASDEKLFIRAVRNETPDYRNEKRYVRKDGTVIWVRLSAAFIRDAAGAPVSAVAACEDITERKAAQEALRQSEEQLRLVLEYSNDAVFWADADTGILVRCNRKAEELTERGRDELIGMHQSQLHPSDLDYRETFRRAAALPTAENIEAELLSRTGKRTPVLISSSVVVIGSQRLIQGVFRDISQRKRMEEALALAHTGLERKVQERTARLRQVVERLRSEIRSRRAAEGQLKEAQFRYRTVADFTYDWEYWQAPEGALLYCSPSCERICGWTAGELISDPKLLELMVHPDDQAVWLKHQGDALASRDQHIVRFRIVCKGGAIRGIEHACCAVFGPGGDYLGVRASNRDITARQRAEMEMRQLREELSRVSRVTMAGQLAAAIAHELNQPLGAIVCNAQSALKLLNRESPDVAEAREALNDIRSDSQRAGAVIQRLRSLFQNTGQDRSPVQVNDIVQETVALLQSELVLQGVKVRLDLGAGLPLVSGNATELQQVVLNLVLNALDAMAACAPGARHVHISTSEEGDFVLCSASDSGPGIPAEKLDRIFEPFFSTKAKGMGMGLAISYAIIEAHGGRLWAQNLPAAGAAFHFTLPKSNRISE